MVWCNPSCALTTPRVSKPLHNSGHTCPRMWLNCGPGPGRCRVTAEKTDGNANSLNQSGAQVIHIPYAVDDLEIGPCCETTLRRVSAGFAHLEFSSAGQLTSPG